MARLGGLVLVAAAVLVGPSSAAATSTVFGDDLSNLPFFSSSSLSTTNVIKHDGSAETGSPETGVLVSVRIRTAGGAGSGVVRVLSLISHPDASTYVFRNTSPEIPVTVTPDVSSTGHVTEVLTRRPVLVGQQLGLQFDDSGGAIRGTWNDTTAQCAFTSTPHLADNDLAYSTVGCNNNPILAQGTVESDADHDGFGDETQDQCPTLAATQGACPVKGPPPSSRHKKCKKKKHRSVAVSAKKCKKKHH
jgi:hypothetical protein